MNVTEKQIRYTAQQVNGKGWTVVKVTGSKRTGRTIERVEGYTDAYTMHQAYAAADALRREMA